MSSVWYRTRLGDLKNKQSTERIDWNDIGMPNFEMPNLDSVLLVQWLTESRFGISLLVQPIPADMRLSKKKSTFLFPY